MGLSDSESAFTVVHSEGNSPFMKLPMEIRENIYRHLLVAKHTIREHNMNSKKVGPPVSESALYAKINYS